MKKYLLYGLGTLALVCFIVVIWIFVVLSGLPDVSYLKHYRPPAATEVLDKDSNLLTNYYDRKFRIWVPISGLPDIVIQAVVTAEDDTFFEHTGVNYKATWDALVLDVQRRKFARGGSTITQQMIKNVLLSKEKTISRKLREYVLAVKAEETLTKRQILEIYLNEVEWGDNLYGIEAASRFYLDKHAAGLTPAEAALLAGMLPNPRYYNPYKRMEKARDRQERVLFNMQQAKLITPEEYAAAQSTLIKLRPEAGGTLYFAGSETKNGRPCYQHALEQVLANVFSEHDLYRSGRTIRTTLDKSLQNELSSSETTSFGNVTDDASHSLLIVKERGQIRAMLCDTSREQSIHEMLESRGPAYFGYDVSVVSPQAITREQIVFPVENEVK